VRCWRRRFHAASGPLRCSCPIFDFHAELQKVATPQQEASDGEKMSLSLRLSFCKILSLSVLSCGTYILSLVWWGIVQKSCHFVCPILSLSPILPNF
jgi:hypothetical protein